MTRSIRIAVLLCAAIVPQAWSAEPAQPAAGAPPVAPAALPRQVKFNSKFFTVPVAVAEEVGFSRASAEKGSLWPTILPKDEVSPKLAMLLANSKGVDLLAAPGAWVNAGQHATIQVMREVLYPTTFKPASETKDRVIPDQFGTQNVGVTLDLEPNVRPDGLIDLKAVINVTAFDGWQNYAGGRRVSAKTKDHAPDALQLPVFTTTRMPVAVTMRFGQTLFLGGFPRAGLNRITNGALWKMDAQGTAEKADPKPDLLFVAISLIEINEMNRPGAIKPIAANTPVEISSQIAILPRAKLAPTPLGYLSEVSLAGLSSAAVPAPSKGLAGLLTPSAAETLLTTVRGIAGVQLLNGPRRKIAKGAAYTPAAADFIPESSGTREANRDLKGRQSTVIPPIATDLMVTPAVNADSMIDLNIRIRQDTNAADAKAGGKGRLVTTSVSIFDGQTVVFSSPDPKRKEQVVLLLIRGRAVD